MRNFNFRMKLNNKFRFMNTGIKLTVLLSTCCLSLSAQENSFYAGIRLGGGYSINNHIDRILVSENYYFNWEKEELNHLGKLIII